MLSIYHTHSVAGSVEVHNKVKCRVGSTNWESLHRLIVSQARIWDLRDLLITRSICYGVSDTLEVFGYSSPWDLLTEWGFPEDTNESIQLALLDVLQWMARLLVDPESQVPRDVELAHICLAAGGEIGRSLLELYPQAVQARPMLQWIIAKAITPKKSMGAAFIFSETWMQILYSLGLSTAPTSPMGQLEAVLASAVELKDHWTKALCLHHLGRHS